MDSIINKIKSDSAFLSIQNAIGDNFSVKLYLEFGNSLYMGIKDKEGRSIRRGCISRPTVEAARSRADYYLRLLKNVVKGNGRIQIDTLSHIYNGGDIR